MPTLGLRLQLGSVAVLASLSSVVDPPENTVLPAISGDAYVGSILTATTGTWLNGVDTYAYQWKADGANVGLNQNTYVPVSGDVGKVITVEVTATNAGGSTPASSSATPAVSVFDPLSLFAGGAYDGFYYDFSKTDRLFQAAVGTAVTTDGNPVGVALEGHSWGGKTLAQELASLPQLVNAAIQTVGNATGTPNNGGFDIVATANFASVNQVLSPLVDGQMYEVQGEWSGNNEGRGVTLNIANNGTTISNVASGTFSVKRVAGTSNELVTLFVNGSLSGETFYLKISSIKLIPGNHGTQSTTPARPFWKTPNFLRPDASDDNLLTTFLCGASGNSAVAKVTVPASLAATQVVMGASGSATARFFVGFNTSGQLVGGVGADSTTTVLSAVDYRGLTGVLALVENGTNWFLYWNGVQVATGARNGAPTTTIPWRLFAFNNNGTAASFAATDCFFAFGINRALSAAEILNLNNVW